MDINSKAAQEEETVESLLKKLHEKGQKVKIVKDGEEAVTPHQREKSVSPSKKQKGSKKSNKENGGHDQALIEQLKQQSNEIVQQKQQ